MAIPPSASMLLPFRGDAFIVRQSYGLLSTVCPSPIQNHAF
ncbi:MAG: hypothetical protein SOY49_00230 [Prevotella sp.]|nr:hypothetical protein [Prevotella sp.]